MILQIFKCKGPLRLRKDFIIAIILSVNTSFKGKNILVNRVYSYLKNEDLNLLLNVPVQ